jgi:hypothetical protein
MQRCPVAPCTSSECVRRSVTDRNGTGGFNLKRSAVSDARRHSHHGGTDQPCGDTRQRAIHPGNDDDYISLPQPSSSLSRRAVESSCVRAVRTVRITGTCRSKRWMPATPTSFTRSTYKFTTTCLRIAFRVMRRLTFSTPFNSHVKAHSSATS